MFLRKNTASQTVAFSLVNATSGAALTGATVSVRRCLDGTFAAAGGTVTEDSGGLYKFAPTQADTNADQVAYYFTATSAIPVCLNIRTTAADMADSVRFGLTALPNAAAGGSGGVPTGDASGHVTLADSSLTTAKLGTFVLAKTTNISGFNDIAATAVVSGGAITTSGGAVSTVTTLTNLPTVPTNWLTAAGLASDAVTEIQSGLATAANLATVAGYLDTEIASILADTDAIETRLTATRAGYLDNLDATVSSRLAPTTAGRTLDVSATGTAGIDWSNVDGQSSVVTLSQTSIATVTDGVPAVTVGAINDAAITATTFGVDIGDVIPAPADVAAIKAKTDNLPASPASTGDVPTAIQNADAIIGRNIAGGSSAGRTVGQALASLRNKVAFDVPAVGQFTVFGTDDTTPLWIGTYTATAGASPVTSIDPA